MVQVNLIRGCRFGSPLLLLVLLWHAPLLALDAVFSGQVLDLYPLQLRVVQTDDHCWGSAFYPKNLQTRYLKGEVLEDGRLEMVERDDKGHTTGGYVLRIRDNRLMGLYQNAPDNRLPLLLTRDEYTGGEMLVQPADYSADIALAPDDTCHVEFTFPFCINARYPEDGERVNDALENFKNSLLASPPDGAGAWELGYEVSWQNDSLICFTFTEAIQPLSGGLPRERDFGYNYSLSLHRAVTAGELFADKLDRLNQMLFGMVLAPGDSMGFTLTRAGLITRPLSPGEGHRQELIPAEKLLDLLPQNSSLAVLWRRQ